MTPLEIIAAAIGIVYLLLEYRASVWMWLFGLGMDVCYCYLYWQSQCYANAGIYVYYAAMCVWGGLLWLRNLRHDEGQVRSMPPKAWLPVGVASVGLTLLVAWLLQFTNESQYLWFDALTAALSIVGMVLMAKKYYQQWVFWLITNPLYVVFNLIIGMPALALMFAVYTVVSVLGIIRWKKMSQQ